MRGTVTGYGPPYYNVAVVMGARTRSYRVHASNVTAPAHDPLSNAAAAPVTQRRRRTAAAAAGRTTAESAVDANTPDDLDPFALNQRFAYAPAQRLTTGVIPGCSKHKDATESMLRTISAAALNLDDGRRALVADYEFFPPLVEMFFLRGEPILPIVAFGHTAKSSVLAILKCVLLLSFALDSDWLLLLLLRWRLLLLLLCCCCCCCWRCCCHCPFS
jgi:hypothetical protein